MEVAFFLPCLNDRVLPRPAIAAVKIIEHLGHRVVFPEEQRCCGQPFYNNGYRDSARECARHFIETFAGFANIVTTSASCTAMVVEHYPHLIPPGDPLHGQLERVRQNLFEFSTFLTERLGVASCDLGATGSGVATYHQSCHHRQLPGDETDRLLAGVTGLDVRPLEPRERCCGFGGTFMAQQADVTRGMLDDRLDDLQATGADTLICSDAGCALNLASACKEKAPDVRVLSLAELLAEGLGLMERGSW